jgi:hypothetical protein
MNNNIFHNNINNTVTELKKLRSAESTDINILLNRVKLRKQSQKIEKLYFFGIVTSVIGIVAIIISFTN